MMYAPRDRLDLSEQDRKSSQVSGVTQNLRIKRNAFVYVVADVGIMASL